MPPPGATIQMWKAGDQPTKPAKPPKPGKAPKGTKPTGKLPKEVRRRPLWLRILKWTFITGFALTALAVATVALVFYLYGRDPALNKIDFTKLGDYHPKQLIEVLDANDKRIGELVFTDHTERRTFVTFEETPTILVDAFVAAEDNAFWEHGGVDYWGMFRAAVTNLKSGKKQGASTITQQVVKTFLLTPEQTYKRKIQEVILARRLEHALTKEEIITLYMNQIYFGHGRYGVQEASRFYFGHPISKYDAKTKKWTSLLNAGEAAMLAGIVQAPENISPKKPKNQPRAKLRQTYVLNNLVKMGKLAQDEAQKWINAPIQIVKDPFPDLDTAPEWTAMVKKQLVNEWKDKGGEDELAKQGGSIRTTLDPSLQQIAQKALQSGLRAVDKRQGVARPVRTVKDKDKIQAEIDKLAKKLPSGGPQRKEMYDAIVTAVHDDDKELEVDLGHYKAAVVLGGDDDDRFNPDDKAPSERFKVGDVIEVSTPPTQRKRSEEEEDAAGEKTKAHEVVAKYSKNRVVFSPGPEGAVVVIDVHTRKVKALVGGYSPKTQFNRATQALRQPGSSFKPYVYTAAFEYSAEHPTEQPVHTPARIVNDAQEAIGTWTAKNYETGKFEGPVRLRKALALSINTVAIIVGEQIGPDRNASASKLAAMAHSMGINTKLPETWSLSIGAGEVTPLENTNGMATIAAGGIAAPPVFIEAIDGKAVPPVKGEQVIKPEVAYVVANMMQSVVTEGTGIKVSELKIPVAGKTGTSNDEKDTWFIGLTPDLAIGVWVGYDEPRHMAHEQGGKTAAPVYVDIMKALNPPAKAFVKPAHVVERTIDKETGLLAAEGAPKGSTMTEVFVEGTAPTETAAKPGDVTPDNAVSCEYDKCD